MSPLLTTGRRTWRQAVRDRVSHLVQSMGWALRFRCARLKAFYLAARALGRAGDGNSRSAHAFHTGGQRQPDAEGGPLTRLGVDDDLSAVGGHQRSRDRQAEPDAAAARVRASSVR